MCSNFAGSYNCSCREGYLLGSDGLNCTGRFGSIKCVVVLWLEKLKQLFTVLNESRSVFTLPRISFQSYGIIVKNLFLESK